MATVVETDTPGNSCSSSCPTTADTGRDCCHGDVSSEDKPNDKDFDTCQPVLTKRQLKKLKKQERWLKIKPDKRLLFSVYIFSYLYLFAKLVS